MKDMRVNGKYEGLSVFALCEVCLVTSMGVHRRLCRQDMGCEVDFHGTGGGVCGFMVGFVFYVDYGVLLAL